MQADQLTSCQSRLRELQTSLSEAEGQLLPAQYSLAKLGREQASQAEHVSWLEAELASKTAQVSEVRLELTNQNEELVAQLALARSESSARADQVDRLQDEAALREERLSEFAKRAQDLEEQSVEQREGLLAELQASKRLADLYKRHFDEATVKVSELEEANAMWQQRLAQQQQQFQSKLAAQVELADEVLRQSEGAAKTTVAQLEQELVVARSKEQSLQQQVVGKGQSGPDGDLQCRDLLQMQDSVTLPMGLSVADMLDKVVCAEKNAAEETRKRKECELYLERILKDVESKAPLISSQRRDYKRVLESHAQLSKRVDDLVNECSRLKTQVTESDKAKKAAVMEASGLESQCQDLARQLQHLLKKSMGLNNPANTECQNSGTDARGVISDHLVTFDGVEELQVRNMQLLKVVRKLSGDQEEALLGKSHVVAADDDSLSPNAFADMEEALKAAVAELAGMRESRQRMEEMVASLVQQRDIYRAMLEEVDSDASTARRQDEGNMLQLTSPHHRKLDGEIVNQSGVDAAQGFHDGAAAELRREAQQHKEEVRMLQERSSRLEVAEAALSEAVDNGRDEIARLRTQLATASSEAKFQSHRVTSLESALETSRGNEESLARRRSEAEGLLLSQQKEARQLQDMLLQLRESLRLTEEKARRSDIAVEVGRAAEVRLQTQIKDLRDEIGRQSALSESMGRIEASLASRMQEEREGLEREVQSLTQALDRNRKEFSESVMISEQKVQTLEDELRLSRAEKERKAEEAAALREDLARQQGTCAAAQERSAVLERQLTIAQDRLAAVQGISTTDSLLATENEQKDVELERAYREISDLKMQLETSETHVVQFRTVSNSTETMLRELQKRSAENRQALEEELSSVKKELETARKELSERRDQLMEAMDESENSRKAMQITTKQLEDDLKASRHAQEAAETVARQAETQAETMRCDAIRSQEDTKEATKNYERELAFHAKAAADLRAAERRLEATQSDLELAQHKTAELSAQCLEHELRRQEQEAAAAKALASLKEDVAAHRHTNDLLHSQVQSMSVQLSRLASQNSRVEDAEGGEDSGGARDDNVVDEAGELKKSAFELREVIRYMKREKDMTEARMNLAETEKHRYSAQLSSVQKALDEARADLQRELASKSLPTRSEDDFAKLMLEITQLNVVRESNAHLRSEYEQVSRERDQLAAKLHATVAEAEPVRERVCRLEGQLEGLEAEKAAVEVDAGYWKDRLHQLVSRYSDVDPEEHRVLQEKLTSTEAELVNTREQLVVCQTQLKEVTAGREGAAQELASVRATADRLDKTNETFRAKLRELNSQKKDLMQQIAKLKALLKAQTLKTETTEKKLLAVEQKKSAQDEVASPTPLAPSTSFTDTNERCQQQQNQQQLKVKLQQQQQQQQQQQPFAKTTAPTTLAPKEASGPTLTSNITSTASSTSAATSDKQKNLDLLRNKLLAKKGQVLAKKNIAASSEQPQVSVSPAITTLNTQSDAASATVVVDESKAVKRKSEENADVKAESDQEAGNVEQKKAQKRPRVAAECTFFMSPAGCRNGDNCRFTHTAPLPPDPPAVSTNTTSTPFSTNTSVAATTDSPVVHDQSEADMKKVSSNDADNMEVEEDSILQAQQHFEPELPNVTERIHEETVDNAGKATMDVTSPVTISSTSVQPEAREGSVESTSSENMTKSSNDPTSSLGKKSFPSGQLRPLNPFAQQYAPKVDNEVPLCEEQASHPKIEEGLSTVDVREEDETLEDSDVTRQDDHPQDRELEAGQKVEVVGEVSGNTAVVPDEEGEVSKIKSDATTPFSSTGVHSWQSKQLNQKVSPFATKLPTGMLFLGNKQPPSNAPAGSSGQSAAVRSASSEEVVGSGSEGSLVKSPSAPQLSLTPANSSTLSSSSSTGLSTPLCGDMSQPKATDTQEPAQEHSIVSSTGSGMVRKFFCLW
jgi:nucleoprotein TPR